MFFFLPLLNIYLVLYIAAALIPALFLMRYIYQKDTVEKEPPALLASLFLRGILAAVVSMALEGVGETVLNYTVPEPGSVRYTMILAFLIVAVVEEGTKYFFCWRRTWKDQNFDCRFDGIVYMVFTSLGFAAIENVMYVFRYGLAVAFPRAVLSVPGHMGFAVVAGALYGRAKDYELRGMDSQRATCMILAYFAAVFLHGFYDTCAMLQTGLTTILFYSFVVIMYILVIRLIRTESASDYYMR